MKDDLNAFIIFKHVCVNIKYFTPKVLNNYFSLIFIKNELLLF